MPGLTWTGRATVFLLGLALSRCAGVPPGRAGAPITACAASGAWLDGAGKPAPNPLPEAAGAGTVLLGEQHNSKTDHAWQLAALTYLEGRRPGLVLGLEMFPRSKQAALDAWRSGTVSEAEFLRQTEWKRVWGFDPELYLPIFRFARDHGIPMVALNVDASLVHKVAHAGWAAIPPAEREGVGTPSPPGPAYRARLLEEMAAHAGPHMKPDRLAHFIEAQLLWDRAMAEAIVRAHTSHPGHLVVALIGEGHLEYRDGVPAQLASLGLRDAAVLMPSSTSCAEPET